MFHSSDLHSRPPMSSRQCSPLPLRPSMSSQSCNFSAPVNYRPRRRRLEAFTTDAKIIRLTRRRVAFFPTAAAARQFFDGDCDEAGYKISHGVLPLDFRPCRLLDKILHIYATGWLLFAVFEIIQSHHHALQSTYRYCQSLPPPTAPRPLLPGYGSALVVS